MLIDMIRNRYTALKLRLLSRENKLKIILLLQTTLFDLIHRTETRVEVHKNDIVGESEYLVNGNIYAASWTRELKKSFYVLADKLGSNFDAYKFVDVGCGKGKALLVWGLLCRKHGFSQSIMGIDYDRRLAAVAESNWKKVLKTDGEIAVADATLFNYADAGSKLIIYMFNPFDHVVMAKVLQSLVGLDTIIVYNNPDHDALVLQMGWKEFHRRVGIWGFNRTVMYRRPSDLHETVSADRQIGNRQS